MAAKTVKETKVYILAFEQAMEIFHLTKLFPPEEKYSLTDQIRRSSGSVCSNLLEAYRKKQYPAHFVSKVSDCDGENTETSGWLDFANASNYIDKNIHTNLIHRNEEIGMLLGHMIKYPERY